MKKIVLVIISILICLVLGGILLFNGYKKEGITIKKNNKIIIITEKSDADIIHNSINDIRKIPIEQSVNLTLQGVIVIKYKNEFIIKLDENEKVYCLYSDNKVKDELRYLPEGFYDWVIGKIEK